MSEVSKKRVRKSTDVFKPDAKPLPSAGKGADAPVGKGSRLEDLPNVVSNFGAVTFSSPHLKMLHTIVLGVGKKREFKANLLAFSGLSIPDDDEKGAEAARDKVRAKIMKLQVTDVKTVMDLADVERGGDSFEEGKNPTKDMLADRLMEWLEEPKESGRNLRKMRTLKGAAKGGKAGGGAGTSAAKKRKSGGEGASSKKKETPPKKKAKAAKETPKKKAKVTKSPGKASGASKKSSKAEEVTPEVKLDIPGASMEQVRAKVKSIVEGADQQELTVKGVRKMLEDWLDCDLKAHKDGVRSLVLEAMNSNE